MKINNKHLIFVFLTILTNLYSQDNITDCKTVVCNLNYYEIIVFKENNQTFFLNVIGKDIDFNKFSNISLQLFINELYTNNIFTPIIENSKYYLIHCEKKLYTNKEELKFKRKLNNLFIKNKIILEKQINLESGEQLVIKGIKFKGLCLSIERQKIEFQNISLYPEEIYDCKEIQEYYIPLIIDKK